LRILNKPLWLLQRDLLSRYCKGAEEVQSLHEIPLIADEELFVHRDNLYFNEHLIDDFITRARASGRACQIAFKKSDKTITTHALPLQEHICLNSEGSLYIADMYYYPPGKRQEPQPLIVETKAYEMGYYSIPRFMAPHGDLVFQVPLRAFLSIENWVHLFLANIPMGVFAQASQVEQEMDRCRLRHIKQWGSEDWHAFKKKLQMVLTSFWERINPMEEQWRNHFLSSKALVKIGKNCSIDPTAIIHGPTTIGDNVYIGPGVVITNSFIGNNVNIMQGSQVMLSIISDRSFLAFNGALFMTSMMENCIVAQNTCLQLAVVGRNSFIGANSVFTDFDLDDRPIETFHRGKLQSVGLPVLGSAVGHNCKIGSGFVVYPGRMIESNVTIVYNDPEGLISKNVPGGSPDDVDEQGEPRRILYRWPNVYERRDRTQEDGWIETRDREDREISSHLPRTSDLKDHKEPEKDFGNRNLGIGNGSVEHSVEKSDRQPSMKV